MNTVIPRELLLTLEEYVGEDARDAFLPLYNESDPEKMVEEVLEVVRISGWDKDYSGTVREYFGLAEYERNMQQYFHDGNQTVSAIFKEMIWEQYCWIGILYYLDCDVSEYVSELMDALEKNSDYYGFKKVVNSIIKALRKDLEDGNPGYWFADYRWSVQDGLVVRVGRRGLDRK